MFNFFKSLKNLDTRRRQYISVVILTILFLITQRIDLVSLLQLEGVNVDFIKPLIISVTTFLLMYWVGEFRIKGERFLTILGFPSIGVFVFSLFAELIITTIFGQLGQLTFLILSGGLFAFFTYILILTANVVNVAFLEDIPLGQAGRAAYYVLNLIVTYLLLLIVISNQFNILIKIFFTFIIPFYIVLSTLWTIKLRPGQRVTVSLLISFLVSFAFFVLSIWPLDSTYTAFILSIVIYITLGIALEVREVITRQVWMEYGLLFTFIFFIILLLSEWGINGTII